MLKRFSRPASIAVALIVASGLLAIPAPSYAQPVDIGHKERSFVNSKGWTISEARRLASSKRGAQYIFSYPTTQGLTVTVGVMESGKVDVRSELLQNLADLAKSEEGEPVTEFVEAQAIARSRESKPVKIVVPADTPVPQALLPFEEEPSATGSSPQAALAGTCGSSYWPATFKVYAEPSTSGTRYGRLYFTWSSTNLANLKACDAVTFEPDFVTYNYDDKHYYSSDITSWSSTMPSAYQDTNAFDSDDERVYTVGTSDASKLVASTRYTTFFRSPAGNASADTMKVVAQKGYRFPSICYSTWCIFADASKRFPGGSVWKSIPATGIEFGPA